MRFVLILIIKFYRLTLSKVLCSCCRFTPSCSQYAILALERFGLLKALFLILKRLFRCNPFSDGGYDPVPEKF